MSWQWSLLLWRALETLASDLRCLVDTAAADVGVLVEHLAKPFNSRCNLGEWRLCGRLCRMQWCLNAERWDLIVLCCKSFDANCVNQSSTYFLLRHCWTVFPSEDENVRNRFTLLLYALAVEGAKAWSMNSSVCFLRSTMYKDICLFWRATSTQFCCGL